MTHIEAIFQGGVFKPVQPVSLPENQRVRLSVELSPCADWETWLREVRKIQQETIKRLGGPLPDSTFDIAADRMRHV